MMGYSYNKYKLWKERKEYHRQPIKGTKSHLFRSQ